MFVLYPKDSEKNGVGLGELELWGPPEPSPSDLGLWQPCTSTLECGQGLKCLVGGTKGPRCLTWADCMWANEKDFRGDEKKYKDCAIEYGDL